jgi:hypothetical protein
MLDTMLPRPGQFGRSADARLPLELNAEAAPASIECCSIYGLYVPEPA